MDNWLFRQNKANSNPIKPKTNPIKAKTNPIQSQFKPNIEAQRKSRLFGNHSSLITIEAQRKSRPLGNHLEGKPNFKQHTGRKKIFKPDNFKKNIYQIARYSLVAVT
jgi:hypothetical protein